MKPNNRRTIGADQMDDIVQAEARRRDRNRQRYLKALKQCMERKNAPQGSNPSEAQR